MGLDYKQALREYYERDLKVLPLDGKSPRVANWQNKEFSDNEILEELDKYDEPAIGILLGPKSGIIDFEYDSEAQHEKIVELFDGEIPRTPFFSSKKGGHYLFAWDDRLEATNAGNLTIPCDNGEKLIIRIGAAGKGSQSAFPPSPNKQWVVDRSIFEIDPPQLPDSVIEKLLEHSQPKQVEIVPDPDTEATPEQIERCREALAEIPDAVEHSEGGGRTINAACEIRRHKIYGEQGYELLQWFNDHKCYPEWSEYDLRRKWNEAKKFEPPACSEFDEVETTLDDLFDFSEPEPKPEKPPLFRLITSAELASRTYETKFAIEGTLVEKQPLIVAGPQKVLKTSILVDACISLASGGSFLGKLNVTRPYKTLVMSGESGEATLKETACRICDAAGIKLNELENLIWSPDLPRFDDKRHKLGLTEILESLDIEVLIIEPAYLCMPGGDAGNLFTQGEMLLGITTICQKLGITLILAHHTKKANDKSKNQPLDLTDIAWAGFQEFARQWWLINRREPYEVGSGDHRLWLKIGGSAGHSALWGVDISEGVKSEFEDRFWRSDVFVSGVAREADKQRGIDDVSAKVLAYLAQFPDGETLRGLRGCGVKDHDKLKTAVYELEKIGKVSKCQILKVGKNHDGFCLKK